MYASVVKTMESFSCAYIVGSYKSKMVNQKAGRVLVSLVNPAGPSILGGN